MNKKTFFTNFGLSLGLLIGLMYAKHSLLNESSKSSLLSTLSGESSPLSSLFKSSNNSSETENKNLSSASSSRSPASEGNTNSYSGLPKQFHAHAALLGHPIGDPAQIARELDRVAAELTHSEMEALTNLSVDMNKDGDERGLAIDLLSRSRSESAAASLKQIATAPFEAPAKDERAAQFEQVLRTMATEGLLQKENLKNSASLLKEIVSESNQAMVQDRAQRALLHLQGKAPSPKEQDEKAYKKMLNR